MIPYALTKFAGFVVTVLVAALLTFLMLDILPGDPARFILGPNATPEALDALRQQLGLDASLLERLLRWLGGLFIGDLGLSYSQAQPAGTLIAARLGVTLPLALLGAVMALVLGVPFGVLAGRKQASVVDSILMALARAGIATPNFWLGMLLVLLFSVTLRWVPPGGFVPWNESPIGALGSLVLPVIALALPQSAIFARLTRDTLVRVQESDHIRAARAKGLTLPQAVRLHGTRNVLLGLVRTLGLQFAYLLAAAVVVENVFYLPGLGRLIVDAVTARDLVLVRASVMALVIVMAFAVFLADVAIAWADPRLRVRREA